MDKTATVIGMMDTGAHTAAQVRAVAIIARRILMGWALTEGVHAKVQLTLS